MISEAMTRADFSQIRYAQCWEDADVLLKGLQIQPGDRCLAIASAGDNALAMLTQDPEKVYAIDLNPAQLACLELRIAAYRNLDHQGLLELIGARSSERRQELYRICRADLKPRIQSFWDQRPQAIRQGIGAAGKFERYFTLFRRWILPWVHCRCTIKHLLRGGDENQRQKFYRNTWDSWRWRGMFKIFFSRLVMGYAGRDPSFFRYVQGSVADRILERTRHALTTLDPAENPYLHWILTGSYGEALPLALRPEHFSTIRNNLDRLEWRQSSLEDFLQQKPDLKIQRFNLSNIFEYMSAGNYQQVLSQILKHMDPGGRLLYWNMLVPRQRPQELASSLLSLASLSRDLHAQDKAFFYSRLVIEEVICDTGLVSNDQCDGDLRIDDRRPEDLDSTISPTSRIKP